MMKKTVKLIITTALLMMAVACQEQQAVIGEKAPDITAFNLKGEQVHLDVANNKIGLLTFWSESCGVCIAELKQLQSFEQQHPQQIKIIAINIDGEGADTAAVVKKHNLDQVLVVKDQLKITADKYHLVGTPTTYILDKNGVILHRFEGKSPFSKLEQLLTQG